MPTGYITVGEAARLLGVSNRAIESRIKTGRLALHERQVTVKLLSRQLVLLQQGMKFSGGPPTRPEPNPDEDMAAWRRWQQQQKRNARQRQQRRERRRQDLAAAG